MGFSMGPSFAFLRFSANLRARTSSFVFSASTEARNFASTASFCWRSKRAVSSRSTDDGGLGGGTCESTTPRSRSSVNLARQHGHSVSKVSIGFFHIALFYPNLEWGEQPLRGRSEVFKNPLRKRKTAPHEGAVFLISFLRID